LEERKIFDDRRMKVLVLGTPFDYSANNSHFKATEHTKSIRNITMPYIQGKYGSRTQIGCTCQCVLCCCSWWRVEYREILVEQAEAEVNMYSRMTIIIA
jgi:hypothetical protein